MFLDFISISFWAMAAIAVLAGGLGLVRRTPGWFFFVAFLFWILSFFAMWSIGWIILGLAFIFLALGIAALLRWDRPAELVLAATIGLAVWAVAIVWFHDYLWLLWPWLWFGFFD